MGITGNSWDVFFDKEHSKSYFKQLKSYILEEYSKKTIYPPSDMLFNAFTLTPPENIKVVIVGQDPYHQPFQAHGLAFSVSEGVRVPPSLRNIFKEIKSDLGIEMPKGGNLISWAKQGVFMINAVLSVEHGKPESHSRKGWEVFTDAAISYINQLNQPIVYLLWGKSAKAKQSLIDNPNHLVLQSPHPSPLSSSRGFFGCKHFSKANAFLIQNNTSPIDWRLS